MCDRTKRSAHERSEHLGIGENVLIESDRVIWVSELCLSVGKDAANSDGASVCCQSMPTEGGFVLVIDDLVHSLIIL